MAHSPLCHIGELTFTDLSQCNLSAPTSWSKNLLYLTTQQCIEHFWIDQTRMFLSGYRQNPNLWNQKNNKTTLVTSKNVLEPHATDSDRWLHWSPTLSTQGSLHVDCCGHYVRQWENIWLHLIPWASFKQHIKLWLRPWQYLVSKILLKRRAY